MGQPTAVSASASRRGKAAGRTLTVGACVANETNAFQQHKTHILGRWRDTLAAGLKFAFIRAVISFPDALPPRKFSVRPGYRGGDYPESECASRKALSLPAFPKPAAGQERISDSRSSGIGGVASSVVPSGLRGKVARGL